MATVKVEKNSYTVEPLYQWDVNQQLEVYGLSLASVPEVHFTNAAMSRAIVRQATMDAAGVVRADIPNSLLQKPYTVTAYVCTYSGDTFETQYKLDIPVKARTQPADYTIEDDEEIYSFNALENQVINALAACEGATASYKAAETAYKNAKAEVDAAVADAAKTAVSAISAGDINAYTKEEVMTEGTAALFGGTDSILPNDVFAFLGKYSQHWWRLVANVPTGQWNEVRGAASSHTMISNRMYNNNTTESWTATYSDTVTINQTNGAVSLTTKKTKTYKIIANGYDEPEYVGEPSDLVGKYLEYEGSVYYVSSSDWGTDEVWEDDEDESPDEYAELYVALQKVTSEYEALEPGEVTYRHSTNRNAYPDSGSDDNFIYEYLGVPFSSAVGAPKMVSGSYVGTGLYGSDNPTTLTFDSEPLLVFIFDDCFRIISSKSAYTLAARGASSAYLVETVASWDEETKTLSWYDSAGASNQNNTTDEHFYVAFLR